MKTQDLSTTYLGKVNTSKDSKIKAEESFPISEQAYTMGKLLDATECKVLLHKDIVSHSCLSHIMYAVSHSILYPNLHQEHKGFK